MSKILVIGANSFSGSHFVRRALSDEHHVWGISRSPEPIPQFLPYKWNLTTDKLSQDYYKFTQLDLNTDVTLLTQIIDEFRPQIVVNFAAQGMVAQSWDNPIDWYKTNVVAQVQLHEILRKLSSLERYVHVTTPEVYGSTKNKWIDEDSNFNPSTPYAVSRAACDMHLKSFFKAYDFPVIFTRAANVYGPGQQLYRIIPRTVLSAKCNQKLYLHGNGVSERAFIHIDDVVEATMQLAHHADLGTTWHISSNKKVSIKNLVSLICDMTGVIFDDIVQPCDERLGKDQTYLLDSTKIRSTFGWSDKTDLESGIAQTIQWIADSIATFKTLPWDYIHKS